MRWYRGSVAVVGLTLSFSSLAHAGDAAPPSTAPEPASPPAPRDPEAAAPVTPPQDPQRQRSAVPNPAEPAPRGRTTFEIDPIVDGGIIGMALGFAGVADLISSTGEIRPQQISTNFERDSLLAIDRSTVSPSVDNHASMFSNIGLVTALSFAAIDPLLTGAREHNVQAGIADAFIYAESLAITLTITDLTKMAVRRPRPIAYIAADAHRGDPTYSNADTDSALSFFSGHSAAVASVGAAATYLAFARSGDGGANVRPWVTMGAALALDTFVSIERVRARAHFPTDVIAGSIVGTGIGLLVPHLHRTSDAKQRRVWIGFTSPEVGRGGTMNFGGNL